jgi:hypothetical protein
MEPIGIGVPWVGGFGPLPQTTGPAQTWNPRAYELVGLTCGPITKPGARSRPLPLQLGRHALAHFDPIVVAGGDVCGYTDYSHHTRGHHEQIYFPH